MVNPTWAEHELPLLEQLYEAEREDPPKYLSIVRGGGASCETDRVLAAVRLIEAGYVEGNVQRASGGRFFDVRALRLTERGLVALGAWPSAHEAGDVFLEALQQLIDQTEDPGERSRLERLKGIAGDVSKATLTALVVGAVKGLGGLA